MSRQTSLLVLSWLLCAQPSISFLSLQAARVLTKGPWRATIVDAEFEPVQEEDEIKQRDERKQPKDETSEEDMSLLDLSLKLDPEIGSLRIPFVDGENCIDTKVAFTTELDGVDYLFGVPADFSAAITVETKEGSVENVSPDSSDSDENVELMEIMAAQLQEHVGDDLRLIRSPRVFTISGPLDKYTSNWEDEILPKSVDIGTLLDEEGEDVDSFLDFMKEELGEDEFTKTMNEEHTFGDDVLSLFSVPGLGDKEDELEQFMREELMNMDDASFPEKEQRSMDDVVGKGDLNHDGVALKLVSYSMPGGKRYSLVQLLKPVVLVAKQAQTGSGGLPRFELLTPQELRLVSPRLEEVCQADLQRTGLSLEE